MWPRHTGDFSMFRIYADANGEPAEYSSFQCPPENQETPEYLYQGAERGRLRHDHGFPGKHQPLPHRLGSERNAWRHSNANRVSRIRGTRRQAVLKEAMAASDKATYSICQQVCRFSSNYWKNSIGMNKAIIDNDVLGTKAEQEKLNSLEFAKGKNNTGLHEGVVAKIDEAVAKTSANANDRSVSCLTEAFSRRH